MNTLPSILAAFDKEFRGELWLGYPEEDMEEAPSREALKSFLSSSLQSFALHQKQELKRKVLEVVPKNEKCSCEYHGTFASCECNTRNDGRNEVSRALIQFFDKEEGE